MIIHITARLVRFGSSLHRELMGCIYKVVHVTDAVRGLYLVDAGVSQSAVSSSGHRVGTSPRPRENSGRQGSEKKIGGSSR